MSKYNPLIHHRRSIRLKGYDYSQAGAYFVTFCTQHREHFFGHIEKGEMIFNDAGSMVNKWWEKLPSKFPDIELGEFITMPNHFHGIVINNGTGVSVIADDTVDVGAVDVGAVDVGAVDVGAVDVGADPRVRPEQVGMESIAFEPNLLGEHVGSPLHTVVQWFKTMSTNEYIRGVKEKNWKRFDKKVWQRNYYEHIIRDERSFNIISNYIRTNPVNWEKDKLK